MPHAFSRPPLSRAALALLLLGACFLRARRTDPVSGEPVPAEFPEAIHTKTPTRTFNSFFYYALDAQGRVWVKSIPGASPQTQGEAPDWQLFLGSGLPHDDRRRDFAKPARIESINADQDELMAVSDEHRHYSVRWFENPVFKEDTPPKVWADQHGWPVAMPYVWDARVEKNRGWAVGRRTRNFASFEDPLGRTFDGGGGLSTYYFLAPDGTAVYFADSGLPPDFSHTLCGPERSTFIAEALQVAGDTMFVINAYGELRTRLADFDTSGSDTMFFVYTYDHEHPRKDAIAVPSEDWFVHKPVPLTGQAQISTEIAIALTGRHNRDRELRVAGYDENRRPGYYAKRIFDQADGSPARVDADEWKFHEDPELVVAPEKLLDPADTDPDEARAKTRVPVETPRWKSAQRPPRRVPVKELVFQGELRAAGRAVPVTLEMPDFHLDCSPARLRVSAGGDTVELTLHTVDEWYHLLRFDPGHDGTPKAFLATLEIPEQALATGNAVLRDVLENVLKPLAGKDMAFFAEATDDYFEMASRGGDPKSPPAVALYLGRAGRAYPSFATAREVALRHDAFERQARDPAFTVGRSLGELTKDDLKLLEARIAANEKLSRELTDAANAPDKLDARTPEWLSASVLGALKALSGPEAIKFIVPALPFRNVTNEEASYYAGILTRSMPPLLQRSRELKDVQLSFARRDLQRALAIIEARIGAYRRRAEELEKRSTPRPFTYSDDETAWWRPFRFDEKEATLHGGTAAYGCRYEVSDRAIFEPEKRAVFSRRPGPAGFFVDIRCGDAGHDGKVLLRIVPTRWELDEYEASLRKEPVGSPENPLKTPVLVQVEAADYTPQTRAALDALFPTREERSHQEITADLTVSGSAIRVSDRDFALEWTR